MSKAVSLLLAGLLAPAAGVNSQSLDDLKTPSLPAFTVLDIAPIAIERPSTPRALGLGLLTAARTGGLPDSYAMEVAPYWLTPKPFLTFTERYDPSPLQSILQSFALSIATAPMAEESVDSIRLGVGFRLLLLPGRPAPDSLGTKDTLNSVQGQIDDLSQAIDDAASDSIEGVLRARRDSLEDVSRELALDLADAAEKGPFGGVRWELAGGVGSLFPQSEFAGGRITSVGIWSSVSLSPARSGLDFVALGRYQHLDLGALPPAADSTTVDGEQDVFDVGGRLLWAVGSFELSAEFLSRLAFDVTSRAAGSAEIQYDNTYQATGAIKYVLSDNAAIRWAFGRGFVLEGAEAGTLIADLALQLGFGPELALPF